MKDIYAIDTMETSASTPMKIYCDASFDPESKMGFGGVVAADHMGTPFDMACQTVGKTGGSHQTEYEMLRRMLTILEVIDEVQHLVVYCDCRGAVETMLEQEYDKGFESVRLIHADRDETMIADMLARHAGDFGERHGPTGPDRPANPKYGTTD